MIVMRGYYFLIQELSSEMRVNIRGLQHLL